MNLYLATSAHACGSTIPWLLIDDVVRSIVVWVRRRPVVHMPTHGKQESNFQESTEALGAFGSYQGCSLYSWSLFIMRASVYRANQRNSVSLAIF